MRRGDLPWPLRDVSPGATAHEILPDGRIHLTIEHRPLPGVTPEMLAWWYRVLPISQVEFDGALRPMYHLFHPFEHGRIWVEAPAADGQPGVGAGRRRGALRVVRPVRQRGCGARDRTVAAALRQPADGSPA